MSSRGVIGQTSGGVVIMRAGRSARSFQVTSICGCQGAIPDITRVRPHAANCVIAAGLCDLEGNSTTTTAVACLDAQTMQRGCSTAAKDAASRVFSVE